MGSSKSKYEEKVVVQNAIGGSNQASFEEIKFHLSTASIILTVIALVLGVGLLAFLYRMYRKCHMRWMQQEIHRQNLRSSIFRRGRRDAKSEDIDYGKEITEMFVELTIAQSSGNSDCYNILKPLNEKYAIKKFADGLRNRRLSTVITSRNYSSLKDAIQAAMEEDIGSASTSAGEILEVKIKSLCLLLGQYKDPGRKE
ncbi:hypothetical protein SFRURICE_003483, partial [Spodoptera frugiperda]